MHISFIQFTFHSFNSHFIHSIHISFIQFTFHSFNSHFIHSIHISFIQFTFHSFNSHFIHSIHISFIQFTFHSFNSHSIHSIHISLSYLFLIFPKNQRKIDQKVFIFFLVNFDNCVRMKLSSVRAFVVCEVELMLSIVLL